MDRRSRKRKVEGPLFTPFTAGERRNVEIKARIEDLSAVAARAYLIADQEPVEILQEDIYFNCSEGRLKLRRFSSSEGELIFYERADTAAAKESRYRILPTSDPDGVIKAMIDRYGYLGNVRKTRTVYFVDNARIHLDDVDGLGSYVEIEVVLGEGETVEQGTATVAGLMERLGIREKDLVGESYIDLLSQRESDDA